MTHAPRIVVRPGIGGRFDRLRRRPAGNILIAFVAIQAACIVAALIFPDDFRYLSAVNISVMLKAIPILGVMSLGAGVLMIAGEFDLSIGSVYAFTAVLMCILVEAGLSAWLAAPIALLTGVAICVTNGVVTLRFKLPSFIVTLGAMLFWKGMILFIHGAQGIRFAASDSFKAFATGAFGPVEMTFVWFVILTVGFHLVMRHHRFGNHVYAVGGNRAAAVANGIDPVRVKLIAFASTGAMAAFAGVLAASRVGSVTPTQGAGLELQAIAACVIGGLALTGGRGSMIGVFLGTVLIYTIQDVLLLVRAPGFYLDIFVGALIVLAAISNQVFSKEN